jgi:hypothetical protein
MVHVIALATILTIVTGYAFCRVIHPMVFLNRRVIDGFQ